jgi:hypothetical protein
MANKTTLTPEAPRRRRGRPTKEEEVRRALAELGGIDPATIDPRKILAAIASDPGAPASARVAACKTLLGVQDQSPAEDSSGDINARAVAIMQRRTN